MEHSTISTTKGGLFLKNVSVQAQYEKLVSELKDIENKVNLQLTRCGTKTPFKLKSIFYKLSPINQQLNQQILNIFAQNFNSEQEIKPIADYVKYLIKQRRTTLIEYIDKDVEFVIERYLVDFYNKYFTINNGQIIYTHLEKYDPSSIPEYDKKLRRSLDNSLPLVIMPSGRVYFSATCHKALCAWLTAHGEELSGSMRVLVSPQTYKFSMTSMWNYGYTENSTKDNKPVLTLNQANTIYMLYSKLKSRWASITPINEVVYMSAFFDDTLIPKDLSRKNLITLEGGFRDGGFRVRDYDKYCYNRLHGFIEDLTEFD